jgi:hypothetical protein
MNTITSWRPLKEMEELQNRLSNLFSRFPTRMGDGKEESISTAEWAPLVDITERTVLPHPRAYQEKPPARFNQGWTEGSSRSIPQRQLFLI